MEYAGESMLLRDFVAKHTSLSYDYVYVQLRAGMSPEALVAMPPGQKSGKEARLRHRELRSEK